MSRGARGVLVVAAAFAACAATPAPASAEDDPETGLVADAAEESDAPVRFTLYWENDGTIPRPWSNSDKHYTNGLKFDAAWHPEWARRLAPHVPFHDQFGDDLQTAFGVSVGQLMFTPRYIGREGEQRGDRPYAGWLAFSAYWQRAGSIGERVSMFDHVELDAGIVGPWSGAGALQEFVHSAVPNQTEPEGWTHQLHNEPAFNLTMRRKWRFSSGATDDGFEFQAIPSAGFTLGTVYRQLEGSVTARLGWNLPDDFGLGRISDVGSATGGRADDVGFYVFGSVGARLVEHNIFLDGNTWTDSLSVSKEPLVLDLRFGAALQIDGFEIGWSQTAMSEEFEGQDEWNGYGTLLIRWTVTF